MHSKPIMVRVRACIPALLLACLAWGCGDDSPPSGVAAPTQQQIQDGTAQLGDFVDSASGTPGAQLLDSAAFQEILNALGAPAVAFGLPQPPGASPSVRRLLEKLGGGQHRMVQADFGTYERDPQNLFGPFPGWMLVLPGDPPDGFVFRFDRDDGIFVYDEMGTPVPVRGEFRFVDIVVSDAGTPGDPTDDFPTSLVIEIAATDAATGSLPLLVRFELHATFDGTGELATLALGDPLANDPGDPGASFIGPVLLAVAVEAGLTTTEVFVQIYDSMETFVVRLDVSVTEDPASGLTEAAHLEFQWGVTRQPTSAPWAIAIDLDNFRMLEGSEIADVTGLIAYRRITLATLAGDTSEVPVDVDGDEIPDLYCINVMVTFADAPEEPQNLCEALPVIQELLGGGVPKLVPHDGGWR